MYAQVINLINMEKGDVKYRIINFNDGEDHIVLESELDHKSPAHIIARITNGDDLFILMQVGDILKRHGIQFSLFIPYLMGMRMDRVITFNESFSLKLVADAINAMGPTKVTLVEPHSEVAVNLIKNCQGCYMNIHNSVKADYICFPDEGAVRRYVPQFKCDDTDIPIITCQKKRDPETGKLSGFEILNPENYKGGSICVVDDLCDGGGTFAGIADVLREKFGKDFELSIHVTHMVNPRGIDNLAKHYDKVVFTDSYRDWKGSTPMQDHPNVICQTTWS